MSTEADGYRELADYCFNVAHGLPPGYERNHMMERAERWLEFARAAENRTTPPPKRREMT